MTLGVYIGSVSDTTQAIGDYYRARHVGLVTLRVELDYGERVHRPITKFEPETRLQVQDNGRYRRTRWRSDKNNAWTCRSPEAVFLVSQFEVARAT